MLRFSPQFNTSFCTLSYGPVIRSRNSEKGSPKILRLSPAQLQKTNMPILLGLKFTFSNVKVNRERETELPENTIGELEVHNQSFLCVQFLVFPGYTLSISDPSITNLNFHTFEALKVNLSTTKKKTAKFKNYKSQIRIFLQWHIISSEF